MTTYTKTTVTHKKEFNDFVNSGKKSHDPELFIQENTPKVLTLEELDYATKCIRKHHKKTNSNDETTQTKKTYYPPTTIIHKEAFNEFIKIGKDSKNHKELITKTTTDSSGLTEEELCFAINTINKYHRLH